MSSKVKNPATAYYNSNCQYSIIENKDKDASKMHGSRRVITFCFLTTVLPTLLIILPLYLRNIKYADVMYKISDSDVIQIHKGQSSIFCEKHSLKMNSSFNAFQMKGRPELSDKRKQIRLKKSMSLPDDTLEYWGFYLVKGANVKLRACSRYEGSKILVVQGDKILNTCGILEGNKLKKDPFMVKKKEHALVTLENPDQTTKKSSDILLNNPKENYYHSSNITEESEKHTENQLSSPNVNKISSSDKLRQKRESKTPPLHNPNTVLDAGVYHGGNAYNTTFTDLEKDVSSFEINLHECYHDNILVNNIFPNSIQCSSKYLENTTTLTLDILLDGYYYYIFYSDNDFVINDIQAIFDISKPTFQYVNMSESKMCINSTECNFDVGFLSDELVIVEIPTKDGIQFGEDDSSVLVSICEPRISVYVFFPISVLLLILVFAFL